MGVGDMGVVGVGGVRGRGKGGGGRDSGWWG